MGREGSDSYICTSITFLLDCCSADAIFGSLLAEQFLAERENNIECKNKLNNKLFYNVSNARVKISNSKVSDKYLVRNILGNTIESFTDTDVKYVYIISCFVHKSAGYFYCLGVEFFFRGLYPSNC